MKKILIVDSYYPEFLQRIPIDPDSSYHRELRKVLDCQFGTSDFYSNNLQAYGWDARDVIANCEDLQELWRLSHNRGPSEILKQQIESFDPDVVFLQDLSLVDQVSERRFIAGQMSCPWAGDDRVKRCQWIATSFPHYVERIQKLGVAAVYLPLAFEPRVLLGMPKMERDLDISFVGGVGRDLHWRRGTDLLEAVAEEFGPRFHWYGYGIERLPNNSPLRKCYRGEAWGRQMYEIYSRSKIVINRHGEVAEGFANNMRMFEATGCGAMLLTETARNMNDLFGISEVICYGSVNEAIEKLHLGLKLIAEGHVLAGIAACGQRKTLADHNYAGRMGVVSRELNLALRGAN